jgi:hypothetical protein
MGSKSDPCNQHRNASATLQQTQRGGRLMSPVYYSLFIWRHTSDRRCIFINVSKISVNTISRNLCVMKMMDTGYLEQPELRKCVQHSLSGEQGFAIPEKSGTVRTRNYLARQRKSFAAICKIWYTLRDGARARATQHVQKILPHHFPSPGVFIVESGPFMKPATASQTRKVATASECLIRSCSDYDRPCALDLHLPRDQLTWSERLPS